MQEGADAEPVMPPSPLRDGWVSGPHAGLGTLLKQTASQDGSCGGSVDGAQRTRTTASTSSWVEHKNLEQQDPKHITPGCPPGAAYHSRHATLRDGDGGHVIMEIGDGKHEGKL